MFSGLWRWLLTGVALIYIRHKGVKPTNTAAARAVRPEVLWRTGSVGIQSAKRSRWVEVMTSMVATLTQQPRHVTADRKVTRSPDTPNR
jgi:hypothetical protein